MALRAAGAAGTEIMARILIVDDDPVQRRLLEGMLSRLGYEAVSVEDGEAALARLAAPQGPGFDLVLLDLLMPKLHGLVVLERMRALGLDLPVIVQTAQGSVDTAVSAIRAGAVDFVVKPVGPERLQVSVQNALKARALEGELARSKRRAAGAMTFRDIVTKSPAMRDVIRLGERAAHSDIPVLIEGESGVGKELVARAIQGSSARRARPFVAVNCGAIPQNLVESILFGHEKGAFTGAGERHVGKFVEAHGGTLFLDEVGELPLDAQVKLLRAVQEGEVDPVGARKPVRVDFRLISATNRSLAELVREGRFREDLYYRLNVFPIRVPPLRERREDIASLARHFTARFAAEEGRRVLGISPDAVALLEAYDWPGNVRQLESAVFRAVVLAEGSILTPAEFPQIRRQARPRPWPAESGSVAPRPAEAGPVPVEAGHAASAPAIAPEAGKAPAGDISDMLRAEGLVPAGDGYPSELPVRVLDEDGDLRPLDDIEADLIRLAVNLYRGRMTEVARRLGIGRSTLYRRLKELGLEDEDRAA